MKKLKIKSNREPLTKIDIEKNMNFEKFYSGYASNVSWLSKATLKISLSVSASVIAVVGIIYIAYTVSQKEKSIMIENFINPPVQNLNITPDIFLINGNRDTTIFYKDGTSINIPANTFATKDGNEIKGKIKLCYREFHDQVDFIFSGIPMHYDSAGTHYQFESAGMFEILAFNNDEPAFVKKDKQIIVNMLSYNAENYFNVYYLDTIKKRWLYDKKNTNDIKEGLTKFIKVADDTFLNENLAEEKKLIAPRKANPLRNNFIIDYNKEEFPELCAYDGVKFEISETDKNYNPGLSKIIWDDVQIKRQTDNSCYMVIFKADKKTSSFIVVPVFDEKDFDAAIHEYEKRRKERIAEQKLKTDSLHTLAVNYTYEANQNNNSNEKFDGYVKKGQIFRAIVVGRLGVWNCDISREWGLAMQQVRAKIAKERKAGFPNAYFTSNTGEKIFMQKIFLANRNMNAIYPLYEKDIVRFPVSLLQNTDIMVGISSEKQVYFIKDEDLKHVSTSMENVYFTMEKIEGGGKGMVEMKRVKEKLKI